MTNIYAFTVQNESEPPLAPDTGFPEVDKSIESFKLIKIIKFEVKIK